jgi:hypothetical protein
MDKSTWISRGQTTSASQLDARALCEA